MYPITTFRGAIHPKRILTRRYVPQVHPFEEPCTPSTYFHHLTYVTYRHPVYIKCHYKISIIGFQTYSKLIPSRSYAHPIHPSKEPCTSSTYFHHLTYITHKHAVYMRCHHKNTNCNHRFPNLFQTHPFEKLCTPRTSLRGTMYIQYIFSSSHLRYIQACISYEMSS